MKNLDHKTQKELVTLYNEVDEFAKAMKARFTEHAEKGKTGFREHSLEHCQYNISQVATEISFNPKKDVDVANWCMIHWSNRKK